MASNRLFLLVILSIVGNSLQDTSNNEIEEEEINPFAEAASAILKEQNAQNIGAMVNSFMQSGGAAQLGNVLSKFGGENAGQLLQGLASLVGSDQKEGRAEDGSNSAGDTTANLLEGLGSLMGAFQGGGQGGGGDGVSAILQGLGSLLTAKGDQEGRQGAKSIDPAMLGSLINMFAQSSTNQDPSSGSKPGKPKGKMEVKLGSGQPFDVSNLISLAAGLLTQGQDKGKDQGINLLNYLPMIMQTISSFTGPEAEKRAEGHSGHSSLLPPYLEKIHIAFDNFIHSDMGKYFLAAIGAEKAFKVFEDDTGRFNYSKFTDMMENLSFRRHWIRMVTDRLVDMLQYASDPKRQKTLLTQAQFLVNSFLKTQGFPKTAYFDPARPTESLSALVDYLIKKYFEVQIVSKEYVKPLVGYVKDLNKLAQKRNVYAARESKELSEKLADTINLEVIEPIARVNRAYRFAKSTPVCDRYVLCLVNEESENEGENLPALKKLLYKGSSLAAAWFLADETGMSFWTYYEDVMDNHDCKVHYSEKCHDFHLEEIRVTTEYVHNEL